MNELRLRVLQARTKLAGAGYNSFPTEAFCKKFGHEKTPRLVNIINGKTDDDQITNQIETFVDHLIDG